MKISELRSKLTFNTYTETTNLDFTKSNVLSSTFDAWGKIILLTRMPYIANTDTGDAKVSHSIIVRYSERILNSKELVSDGITYTIHYPTPIMYGKKKYLKLFCEQTSSSQTTACN